MKFIPMNAKYLLTLLFALSAFAFAQSPEAAADNAVQEWLDRPSTNLTALSGLPTEQLCQQLPSLLGSPPPPEGTRVNFDDRVERETETEDTRRYTYPVTFPNERLEVLEVTLQREGQEGAWSAADVGVQTDGGGTIPRVFQQPLTAWIFILFSLYFVYLLVRPSFFRRWLSEGWALLKGYRALVIGTFIAMFGLFAVGLGVGANLPPVCQGAISGFVQTTVEELGAAEAYGSGNVARAAVVTLYQNFVMGTLVTTFSVTFITLGIGRVPLQRAALFGRSVFLWLSGRRGATQPLVRAHPHRRRTLGLCRGHGGWRYLPHDGDSAGVQGLSGRCKASHLHAPIAFLLLMLGAWYEAAVIILGS